MKNTTSKPIIKFMGVSSAGNLSRRHQQYLCNVKMEAGETKLVKVASPVSHARIVDVSAAGTPTAFHKPAVTDMIINQIQFADNDKWQRSGWNSILSRLGAKKVGKGKCIAL
jgi:hypothetical protein